MGKLIVVSVGLPKELYEALVQVAESNGYASKQEVIRNALRDFIESKTNTSVERKAVYRGHHPAKLPHGDRL